MFSDATAVRPGPHGTFEVTVDPDWFQGPGQYGGASAAMLLRAMQASAPDRPPRSLSVQFCAPVPAGDHRIVVQLERAGSGTTFLSARLVADERVVVHAMATLGVDRSTELDHDVVPPPDAPPADAVPPVTVVSPPFPQFLRNFEMRLASGAGPYAGRHDPRLDAWLRPLAPEPVDAALAVGLLDAMPPVALSRARGPKRFGSVALHAQFLSPLPDPTVDPGAAWLVTVTSDLTRGGYSDQHAELYTPDGRLAALVHQLFAVI
ncbi:MAG: thioesterase family protein [Myxococcota bacterium]